MLKATELGRQDQGQWRLQSFNLALNQGESVGLLGLNGAGKSTALALLAGTLAPTTGRVELNGKDIHRHLEVRRHIGLLPERPALYPQLTVGENLAFAAQLHSVKPSKALLESTLESCGLGGLAKKLSYKLSKGMAQRLSLAQAIVHQPSLLILDEPTAGLDAEQANAFRALIAERLSGCALILASHILTDVEHLCDQALLLDRGQVRNQLQIRGAPRARVRFAHPPAQTQSILALGGIDSVKAQADGWFELNLSAADEKLAERLASQGWGMLAYVPGALDWQSLLDEAA